METLNGYSEERKVERRSREQKEAETGLLAFSSDPTLPGGCRGRNILILLGLDWPLTRHVILRKSLPFPKPQFPSL